jgi:hypothetical protein
MNHNNSVKIRRKELGMYCKFLTINMNLHNMKTDFPTLKLHIVHATATI